MNVITWNVRGLNAPNKQRLLKHCISNTKIDIFLFQEDKLSSLEMGKLSRSLGWREVRDSLAKGALGGLALI